MPSLPPDLLSNLPSVRELLEKPQVKILFQRLGHTDVAVGVRQYLEQLGTDLQQKLNNGPLPATTALSPALWAERAARFVLNLDSSQQRRSVINATGQLYGPDWAGLPLSESAQQAILDVGSGYAPANAKSAQQAADLLCHQTGAEAAWVAHSYESALWLVFSTVARKAASERQSIVVAHAELGHTGKASIREIGAASPAGLLDVGSANVVQLSDYISAINQQTAAILQLQWDSYQTVGHVQRVAANELIPLAQEHGVPFIAAIDGTCLADSEKEQAASAASRLAAGADMVILRGDGLVGSVPCGLILGSRKWIDQLAAQPMAHALSLDPMRNAGLVETLRNSAGGKASEARDSEVPLQRFLETSAENLRHRAQNLADQLDDCDSFGCKSIKSAEAIEIKSALSGQRAISWAVAVTAADGHFELISERLLAAQRPVICKQQDSQFLFDLAAVTPAEDQAILAALTGEPEA